MKSLGLAGLFVVSNIISPSAGSLRVMHVRPEADADPRAAITIIFDRPVAQDLGVAVAPAQILRIEPAIAGRAEWRDPVTLRFIPSAPLVAGAEYRVTISNSFNALDGSRLLEPYRFTVRVRAPTVLGGFPIGSGTSVQVAERPVIRMLISDRVDPERVTAGTWITLSNECGGNRIGMRLLNMRAPQQGDPGHLYYQHVRDYGGLGDSLRDLRRFVELEPISDLPLNCSARVALPFRLQNAWDTIFWKFRTHGPLSVNVWPCRSPNACESGQLQVHFSTPVSGTQVARHVRVLPGVKFSLYDTIFENTGWVLQVPQLRARQQYSVVVDSQLRDVFGQVLGKTVTVTYATDSYTPALWHRAGPLLVERDGPRAIAVRSVNVDTLLVKSIAVADSAEYAFLNGASPLDEVFHERRSSSAERQILLQPKRDLAMITNVRFPGPVGRTDNGTLRAVQIKRYTRADPGQAVPIFQGYRRGPATTALIQVTDLAIHARMGIDQGQVWVTSVRDGRPRGDVLVTLHDKYGKVRASARTDAQGIARLNRFLASSDTTTCPGWCAGFEGYVSARLRDDRALVAINSSYGEPLAAHQFRIPVTWSAGERTPAAATVFTERDIYRPGERVHAKAIVREGPLGALTVPRGDSLLWQFLDHGNVTLRDTITSLSEFGTADQVLPLARGAALGTYQVRVSLRRLGVWQSLATASFRVAEYRAPEFLADLKLDSAAHMAGDTITAAVSARYLFGAPMANAEVHWTLQQRTARPWELGIRNAEDFQIGLYANTDYYSQSGANPVQQGSTRLDARGAADLRIVLPGPPNGVAASTDLYAIVSDANRQSVTVARSVVVHAAELYVGGRVPGSSWLWTAGQPQTLEVIALKPDGQRVAGVTADAFILRREWQYATARGGGRYANGVVDDTVARCRVETRATPVSCRFTPERGGWYVVMLNARDAQGRRASTSFERWALGAGWNPRSFDSPFQVDVTADRPRYAVGDTATLIITSPFKKVEAWLTIERERVLDSRRIRLDSGSNTVRIPITEAHAPNTFVSVLLVRGRSAAPGPPDDPGRPTMRVGYTQLHVAAKNKQLNLQITPVQQEYEPGDTARVRVAVTTEGDRGQRAEVTLWAVDEGVLSLTGYRAPNPVASIYQPRPLGVRLASNLVSVAPQLRKSWPDTADVPVYRPEFVAGAVALNELTVTASLATMSRVQPEALESSAQQLDPRTHFQSTAFFIASVITDGNGQAIAAAKLPDNLTTFRIVAVAVTTGDQYGSGMSSLLVTRPLLARPSLPRFLRAGDRIDAGVVINQRSTGTQPVTVAARARGASLVGPAAKADTLDGAAGREVRFAFQAQPGDSARFEFTVRGRTHADAVFLPLPIRPAGHPVAQTIAGLLRDSARAQFLVDANIDPERSRLEVSVGGSVLSIIRGVHNTLRVYPYACTEQVSSVALPLIALYRAQHELGMNAGLGRRAEDDIRAAIRTLVWRQQAGGSIGYWGPYSWSTPGVTAHATRVLLEARAAGFAVDSTVFTRVRSYLVQWLRQSERPVFAVDLGLDSRPLWLGERLAAVNALSLLGHADVQAENALLDQLSALHWEERVLLAEVLARRGAMSPARTLLHEAWRDVRSKGRLLDVPAARQHYFRSNARPGALLLSATLAIEPTHPNVPALAETLIQQGQALARNAWNTHDYAAVVLALLPYERARRPIEHGPIRVTMRSETGVLFERELPAGTPRDTSFSLTGLVRGQSVRLNLSAHNSTVPVYYYLTLREVMRDRPVTPLDNGIQVERWYESVNTRRPVTSVAAGDLVRVRLRVTIPAQRHFVVIDDPLPAGLEAVDPRLRTERPPGAFEEIAVQRDARPELNELEWGFGSWYWGEWSAFDHKELRDDRVLHFATTLWKGSWTASYLTRATTAGTFVMPPAHAEEMYNPAVNGRTGGGLFTVTAGR